MSNSSSETKWREALESLPATPDSIPAFFFAHGSPILAGPNPAQFESMAKYQGKGGPLYDFLKDFGPTLLKKYNPKGIVVFSAHWETDGERQGKFLLCITHLVSERLDDSTSVTDYGDENPLLFDYYGFPDALYKLKFKSRGDSNLANRVVELYHKVRVHLHSAALINRSPSKGRSEGEGLQGKRATWIRRTRV
jgi:aromatic ring-opening dioxygenase catalytic subunit (LigB family)